MSGQKIPPSQVTQLHAVATTATSVSLAWKAPATGSLPIRYTVFYRVHGPLAWAIGAMTGDVSATVTKLKPATEYEFEVMAHN